jgi:hypothetical protein
MKTGKVSKYSIYGNDFANWGGLDKKLVLRRPVELLYPMKFTGQSSFTIDQKKVLHEMEVAK